MKAYKYLLALMLTFGTGNTFASAEKMDSYQIYENGKATTRTVIKFPSWFKQSFYDLSDDLAEARNAGKRGIIIMLSQENCSTCRAFLKTTFSDPEIIKRVRSNYDVIGINIFSDLEVKDPDGSVTTVKNFAENKSARLTPTILFYGVEHVLLVKIVGFYPPERFQHILNYIDGHFYATMKLSEYLRDKRIKTATRQKEILRDEKLFGKPDYNLASSGSIKRPTLVIFETPNCNPCRRFHERTLSDETVRKKMAAFRTIQLDATDDTNNLITPTGKQMTPQAWFHKLGLSYDIAVVFFDEQGIEVLRHDAETGRFRMSYTMDYVLEKGYLQEQQVLRWRKNEVIRQASEKKIQPNLVQQ